MSTRERRIANRRRCERLRSIYNAIGFILGFIAAVFIVGGTGAYECNDITESIYFIEIAIGLVLAFVSAKLFDIRT